MKKEKLSFLLFVSGTPAKWRSSLVEMCGVGDRLATILPAIAPIDPLGSLSDDLKEGLSRPHIPELKDFTEKPFVFTGVSRKVIDHLQVNLRVEHRTQANREVNLTVLQVIPAHNSPFFFESIQLHVGNDRSNPEIIRIIEVLSSLV